MQKGKELLTIEEQKALQELKPNFGMLHITRLKGPLLLTSNFRGLSFDIKRIFPEPPIDDAKVVAELESNTSRTPLLMETKQNAAETTPSLTPFSLYQKLQTIYLQGMSILEQLYGCDFIVYDGTEEVTDFLNRVLKENCSNRYYLLMRKESTLYYFDAVTEQFTSRPLSRQNCSTLYEKLQGKLQVHQNTGYSFIRKLSPSQLRFIAVTSGLVPSERTSDYETPMAAARTEFQNKKDGKKCFAFEIDSSAKTKLQPNGLGQYVLSFLSTREKCKSLRPLNNKWKQFVGDEAVLEPFVPIKPVHIPSKVPPNDYLVYINLSSNSPLLIRELLPELMHEYESVNLMAAKYSTMGDLTRQRSDVKCCHKRTRWCHVISGLLLIGFSIPVLKEVDFDSRDYFKPLLIGIFMACFGVGCFIFPLVRATIANCCCGPLENDRIDNLLSFGRSMGARYQPLPEAKNSSSQREQKQEATPPPTQSGRAAYGTLDVVINMNRSAPQARP